MTNGNDFAFAAIGDTISQDGLTKREYFAVHATEPLPSSFCQKYILDKEASSGKGIRKTAGNYYELLTPDERIEVRAKWRVVCAEALIKALNETP